MGRFHRTSSRVMLRTIAGGSAEDFGGRSGAGKCIGVGRPTDDQRDGVMCREFLQKLKISQSGLRSETASEIHRKRQLAGKLMRGRKRGRAKHGRAPLDIGARDDVHGLAVALRGRRLQPEEMWVRRVHGEGESRVVHRHARRIG